MSSYLSRIEVINGYSNVRPVMEMVDGGLVEVEEEKFGQYGTITLGALYGTDSAFIQDKKYSIFSISDSELLGLEPTTSGYKIRAKDFLKHCKAVDSSTIRELILLPDTLSVHDYNNWSKMPISLMFTPFTKNVYLADEEYVLGPFSWEKVADRQFCFTPCNVGDDPYFLQCYKKNDFQDPIYTFDAAKNQDDILFGLVRNAIKIDSLPLESEGIDCIDDNGLKNFVGRLLSQPMATKKEKREIKETIAALPEICITESRRNRILELVKNGELSDQAISSIVADVFRSKDNTAIDLIVEKALGNDNYSDQLLKIAKEKEEYTKIRDVLDNQITEKKNELENLDSRIKKCREKETSDEKAPIAEVEKLKQELEKLRKKLSDYDEFELVRNECDKAQAETKEAQQEYATLYKLKEGIKGQIEQMIQSAYASLAFDGAISSLMLQQATQFERENSRKKISSNIARLGEIKSVSTISTPKEMIDFLHEELSAKANRYFSRNDVINIAICLSQGFLTILAGDPGTGKTSLVSLLSTLFGLTNQEHPRYTEIAVEKGWSSRRDLVGYYNPLTKSFDAANKGLFSALATLNAEAENGVVDFPYIVLLDEANLSQMEYYWADFMGLCDFDKPYRKITLSEEYEFSIPDTLRFMGTINLDHTTEPLSPRLIDRAWIIKLSAADMDIDEFSDVVLTEKYPLIKYEVFRQIHDVQKLNQKTLDVAISEKFNRIRSIFQEVGIGFSPRTIGMIKRYCLVGAQLMDTSENSYVALDYAVAQKILPIIDGYGEDYQKMLDNLIKECDQATMPKCYEILVAIQKKGNINMQYYQFFAR